MNMNLMGDYYVWYCEWCDTRNLTLWTRFEKDKVSCGACHRGFHHYRHESVKSTELLMSRII